MKFNRNILTILLVLGFVSACDLDLLDNPNQPTPEQAALNDLYNSIQLGFENVYTSSERNPGQMARMYMNVSFTYLSATTPTTFNGLWGNAYNDLFPNVNALIKNSEGKGFDIHVGTSMIMKAYTMMILVDLFGDVPYTEALQGTDIISPNVDPGSDVYAAAITMLDDAIALLTGTAAGPPTFDNFYGGDPDKWITAAKTMKLRAAMNMGDAAGVNAIISGGDYIGAAGDDSEDFQFNYGSQRNNPNSRHPNYNNHYEVGDGVYISNYYMWLLRAEKLDGGGAEMRDPRLRYYFFRKVDDAAGQDVTSYSCHFSQTPDQAFQPAHFAAVDPRMPYCIAADDGYSGRDHLNGEGIPPDGPIRTSWGLYPSGGDFDDDSFSDTRQSGTTGGLGEGIAPIMLSSFVSFMQAEAVLSLGAAGNARTLLEAGIRSSFDKVESFEGLVSAKMGADQTLKDGSTGTTKELFGMSQTDKDDYVTEVLAMYDAGTPAQQLDIVIKEYYIAAWGNGLEAYNMYRRTGYPGNIMPPLDQGGDFPLSFFYPSNSSNRNSNVTQKANLKVSVFWQDASVAGGLY